MTAWVKGASFEAKSLELEANSLEFEAKSLEFEAQLARFLRCADVRRTTDSRNLIYTEIGFSKVRKSGIMTTRLPDTGLFA